MPRKTKRKTKRKEMEEATEREGEAMRGEEAKAPGALTFVVERMMTHVEFGAAVINEGLKLAARKEKRRVKEIAMQACLKRAMENDDFNAEEAAVMAFKVMSCDEPNLAKYAAMPEKSMVAEHMGVFMGPGPEKGPGPQSSTEAEYVGEGV